MTSSPQEYATNHEPGGVLGITIGKTVCRVDESGSDEMGRWVYFTYNSKGNRGITEIGTNQVCQDNARTVGPTTELLLPNTIAYWNKVAGQTHTEFETTTQRTWLLLLRHAKQKET